MSVLPPAGDETIRLGRSSPHKAGGRGIGSLDQPGNCAPDVPHAAPCRAPKRHGAGQVGVIRLALIEVLQPVFPDSEDFLAA